jgi:hypothetical protein
MSNHVLSPDLHSREHSQSVLPMEYINRMLDRYSRTPSRPRPRHFSAPPAPPAASPQKDPFRQDKSSLHRYHKHKHHRQHKMTSFDGPWSDDLDSLKKAVQSMPDRYRSSFSSASKDVLETVCDPDILHIWETDSDIDNLLQLTSVIAKLCNLGTRKENGTNASDGSMIIIAEEKAGRNNVARICQLVEYLTCANGKKHLDGTVAAFGTIVVVRGWNNSVRSDIAGREVESTVKRINIAIERVFRMSNAVKNKIVWHHGPVIHFLLTWINNTTPNLRNALYAITITGSLNFTDSVKPSAAGRLNTLPDLTRLESYAKKLDIPILFLDPSSQLITFQHLATYMYYYAYYINTFLPVALSRPHLHKAQDELVTFAFQILGASQSKYGDRIVRVVKDHLDPGTAKRWARRCVDSRSYEKGKCRNAGKEEMIHRAVQLADGPFSTFSSPSDTDLPAFARLAVGPAAGGSMEYHTAAPVDISFSSSRMRPSSPAVFHILLPAQGQDLERVTNRMQGLMMAVLERVRQEKGNPQLGAEEKDMWAAVSRACSYALKEAKGKMPKSVEDKVKFVRDRLSKGTWGSIMSGGAGKQEPERGISDAARANQEAVKAYGAGGNMFGQPQMSGMGYGLQGQMGQQQQQMPFAQHQQQYAPQPQPDSGWQQMPFAQQSQQGMMAPPNSPGMGQPQHQPGPQMYAPQQHGQERGYGPVRMVDAGYAPPQGIGGGSAGGGAYTGSPPPMRQSSRGRGRRGGYSQSMGGNWM